MKPTFTERSFRHCQTLGCIDVPEKLGRLASYGFRHFLQALLVRRLLWERVSAEQIATLLTGCGSEELQRMLLGGVEMVARAGDEAGDVGGEAEKAIRQSITCYAGTWQRGPAWKCSDKQKDLLLKLVEERQLDKADIEALAVERFGKGVRVLNKVEASGLIDELLDTYGGSNRQGSPGGTNRRNGSAYNGARGNNGRSAA